MIDLATTDRCYLRVDEVQQLYGVSRRTIYYWVEAGKIPYVRLNHTLRFPVNALRQLVVHPDCVQPVQRLA